MHKAWFVPYSAIQIYLFHKFIRKLDSFEFRELSHLTGHLSQAEMKISINPWIFTQNDNIDHIVWRIDVILCICSASNNISLTSQLEISHMLKGTTSEIQHSAKYHYGSDAGKWKTLGGPVVIGGDNLPSLVGIGLTDPPNIRGGGRGTPPNSGITATYCKCTTYIVRRYAPLSLIPLYRVRHMYLDDFRGLFGGQWVT